MRNRVNRAPVEGSHGIAKDEINMTFDIAIAKVLSCCDAWPRFRPARPASRVERVLRPKETDVAKDGTVTGHRERNRLRALRLKLMRDAEVILKGDAAGKEIVGRNRSRSGGEGASCDRGAVAVDDHYLRRIPTQPFHADMRLGHAHQFAINSGFNTDHASLWAERLDSLLHRLVVSGTVSGNGHCARRV